MSYIDQNKQAYNAIAELFSGTRDYLWDDFVFLEQYITDGQTMLDIGCGNGRLYQLLEKNQVRYIGVDQSEGLIELARQRYRELEFHIADMTELPIEDNSIDSIVSIAAFHHLPDEQMRTKALLEMRRVLKDDGIIFLTNWNFYGDWCQDKLKSEKWWYGEDKKHIVVPWRNGAGDVLGERHYWAFTPEELEELYKKEGFTLVDQYYTKRGKKSDQKLGDNIVSVLRK